MGKGRFTLFVLILAGAASPAGARPLPSDEAIIRSMKAYPVARIDPRLGQGTYESWLRRTLGPWKSIAWVVDDCGEGGDGAGETPICVSTDVQIDSCRRVYVSMVVGSTNGGISAVPMAWTIERSGVTPTDFLDSLGQVEPALQRARELEPEFIARRLAPIDTLAAIQFAQHIQVPWPRHADRPPMTLEEWIVKLAGPQSRIAWKLVGCDATVTSGQLEGCDDYWACVDASADNAFESFIVAVRIGTLRRGIFGEPHLRQISLWNKRINRVNYFLPDLPSLEAQLDSIRHR